MKKHHKIVLSTFTVIVLFFMVITTLVLNGIIIKQRADNQALSERIAKLESQTDWKINELTDTLLETRESLNSNLSEVKKQMVNLNAKTTEDFSGIVTESLPAIATIRTLSSQGTGFFISDDGFLVTNAHVILSGDGKVSRVIQAVTYDGKTYPGNVVGIISNIDLALIKFDGDFSSLELANSSNLKIGEKVIAIGNPEGFQFSVTDGIISAVHRKGQNGFPAYIQTNAELNPGNSGGPLISLDGKVVGMNNFKLVESEGMGFALESNYIRKGVNIIGEKVLNMTIVE